MAQGVKQPPSSVVIQTGTEQQSSLPPLPTLSGQPQSIPNNQYVMQQAITNGTASTAMILGIIGLVATIVGPLTEGLTCFFGWFFGLLGIILGHAMDGHHPTDGTDGPSGKVGLAQVEIQLRCC